MTLHFIYRVPPARRRLGRIVEKLEWLLIRRLGRPLPTTWRGGGSFAEKYRRRAPYSITANLHAALAQRYPVRLYDLFEPGGLRYTEQDILLGHPWPEGMTIANQAMLDPRPCRLKALIFPLHHGLPEINAYAIPYMERADLIFGIMGEYWYDTLDASVFGRFKPKIVPLDMAIDTRYFPYVKTSFNPPGKRGYLYIGRNAAEKGTAILAESLRGLGDVPCGWIGGGEDIPALQREAVDIDLTPQVAARLAQKYDFFVNTSISDANPTTILEAMAWGFPVACTPQSGYYRRPDLVRLSTSDIAHNTAALQALQHAPEDELRSISQANRRLVEQEYTWERFTGTVLAALESRPGGVGGP